jgi:hypothetical protein
VCHRLRHEQIQNPEDTSKFKILKPEANKGAFHPGLKDRSALSFLMFKIGNHLVCHFDPRRGEKSPNTVSCK